MTKEKKKRKMRLKHVEKARNNSHVYLLNTIALVGTSSRSTKLVHGGVRYLEKAVRELDIEQYKLVKEALNERANFLKVAPYLSYQLPIMLPIYKYVSILVA